MTNSHVSIELLKFNDECKYEHFNTSWVSNYQDLFEQSKYTNLINHTN